MKILITGSSGMLGSDLCKKLFDEGYQLTGLDFKKNEDNSPPFTNRQLDVTKKEEIEKFIQSVNPDVVIHTAAYTVVDKCELNKKLAYEINSEGTKNIAASCKQINALIIYISTDYVFDGKKNTPYGESDETNPLSVYGDSKLKGEIAIRENLDKYLIVRTSWLYGKHGNNFIETILSKAKQVSELKIVDDQEGSPTYTVDLSEALLKLVQLIEKGVFNDKNNLGIYHVTNSSSCTWYEYAKEIIKVADIDVSIKPISSLELNRPAKRPNYSVLSNKRFEKLTNFKMRSWPDALREYLGL